MLFFLIFALASAEYYLEKQTLNTIKVWPFNLCLGQSETSSIQYEVVDNKNKKCTYKTADCSGEKTCEDITDATLVSKDVPSHAAYEKAGLVEGCTDHKDFNYVKIYPTECTKVGEEGGYSKYAVSEGKLYLHAYSDANCTKALEGEMAKIESGKCEECKSKQQIYCSTWGGYVPPAPQPPSAANATYVAIEQERGMVVVHPFDVCVKNETASYKYIKEGNVAKKLTYTTVDCKGTETKVDLPATEKPVETFPEHIAYTQEGNKTDCSDHKNMPAAALYTVGCFKAEEGAYIKYVIEESKVFASGFTDNKCTTVATGEAAKMQLVECNKCTNNTQSYCKKYEGYVKPADPVTPPKPDNGNAFTAILMAVFFLFFLF